MELEKNRELQKFKYGRYYYCSSLEAGGYYLQTINRFYSVFVDFDFDCGGANLNYRLLQTYNFLLDLTDKIQPNKVALAMYMHEHELTYLRPEEAKKLFPNI